MHIGALGKAASMLVPHLLQLTSCQSGRFRTFWTHCCFFLKFQPNFEAKKDIVTIQPWVSILLRYILIAAEKLGDMELHFFISEYVVNCV